MNIPISIDKVLEALSTAYNWKSNIQSKKVATEYLDQLKHCDPHVIASIGFELIQKNQTNESRIFGYQLLHHIVNYKWTEFSAEEVENLVNLSYNDFFHCSENNDDWSIRNKSASLLAHVVRSHGSQIWEKILPSVISSSKISPTHAESAVLLLRIIPEDITIFNEDLQSDQRRDLLLCLTKSLSTIFPFIYNILEESFSAAMSALQAGNVQLAQSQAAVVSSSLNTLKSYVEWAPVSSIFNYKLINACGFLLGSQEFQTSACEILKIIASRRKPQENAFEFTESMKLIFEFLMNSTNQILSNFDFGSDNNSNVQVKPSQEFLEKISGALTSFSTQNLQIAINHDEQKAKLYFEIMIRLLNFKIEEIHLNALLQWLTLIREMSATFCATSESQSAVESKVKKVNAVSIPIEILQQILTFSFHNMPIKGFEEESHGSQIMEFETDSDYGKYRNYLIEIIRNIAVIQPASSINFIFNTFNSSISNISSQSPSKQDLWHLERVQIFLENTFSAFPETFYKSGQLSIEITNLTERMIQQLINIKFEHFDLIEIHGHFLDSISPFLKHSPSSIPFLIAKFFSLLNSIPLDIVMSPSMEFNSSAYHSRLQICSSFLRMIRNADVAFIPHLKTVADQITALRESSQIRQSELNHLGEALLLVASFAGPNERSLVINWLLEPIKPVWTNPEWQTRYLSDPVSFANQLQKDLKPSPQTYVAHTYPRGTGDGNVWFVYHMIALFEKILRSDKDESKVHVSTSLSEMKDQDQNRSISIPSVEVASTSILHPMVDHMTWILPPLLRLLRIIQYLWNDSVRNSLPQEVNSALCLNKFEISSFMGESSARTGSKTEPVGLVWEKSTESQLDGTNSRRGTSLHNWIKGIRENIYVIIGQSAVKLGPFFFDDSDSRSSATCLALMESLSCMELHHIRMMIRSVLIPLCKHCPHDAWGPWLPPLLHPLLMHCQSIFFTQWPLLIQTGSTSLSVLIGDLMDEKSNGKSSFKKEVLEEKLLRDLTRELCFLLSLLPSVLSSPSSFMQKQKQPLEMMEANEISKHQNTQISVSLLSFLISQTDMFFVAFQICMECLTWPDSDASHKSLSFLSGVVSHLSDAEKEKRLSLSESIKSTLHAIVSKDLFLSSIRSLSLESNASFQADILSLIRDIYVLFAHTNLSREVLLSFPPITPPILIEFEHSLKQLSSVREQKQLFKTFLQKKGGAQLKALIAQKSPTVISSMNVSVSSSSKASSSSLLDNEGSAGLASIGL